MEQMLTPERVMEHTKKWITDVVIGCNFCPFASKVVNRGAVHYAVEFSRDLTSCLEAFMLECRRLDEDESIGTTLLIFPEAFKAFDDFLGMMDLAEELLADQGYEGIYQVASFHPEYLFADAPEDDPANYTNRSVYPMLHLLREADVEEAADNHPDTEGIPERNVAFARGKGLEHMKRLRDACL